jgi:hypothetical protein
MLSCSALASLWTLGACSSPAKAPMRTALFDLTGESRSVRVYPVKCNVLARLFDCPVAVHRQAVSIPGLLNVPDVGQLFHFPGHRDVTTATGVAVVQSYRLIGETEPEVTPPGTVACVRNALERAQASAFEATRLAKELERLRMPSKAENVATEQDEIDTAARRLRKAEQELAKANEALRKAANQPGVVVARWSIDEERRLGAPVSGGSLGIQRVEASSGFVILAGIRTVSLVFGEDFWWLLNNLRPKERDYIEEIGISTSLLQAREVAYASDSLYRLALALENDVQGRAVDNSLGLKLTSYWSTLASLSNSGHMPSIVWKREPFCAACGLDLPGLAAVEERALQRCFDVESDELDPASYQGWRTVAATISFLRDVPSLKWKDHARTYAKRRLMWSAPCCPFCSKNERPVEVRAQPLPHPEPDAAVELPPRGEGSL